LRFGGFGLFLLRRRLLRLLRTVAARMFCRSRVGLRRLRPGLSGTFGCRRLEGWPFRSSLSMFVFVVATGAASVSSVSEFDADRWGGRDRVANVEQALEDLLAGASGPRTPGLFGTTTVGGTAADITVDFNQICKFTLATAGVLRGLWIYLDGNGSGSGGQILHGLVYSDLSGTPDSPLAYSNPVTVADGQAAGWVFFPCLPLLMYPGDYWLGFNGGSNNNAARYYQNFLLGGLQYKAGFFGDGLPDPFTADGGNPQQMSVWAELATW
jgi:hypothetical protein